MKADNIYSNVSGVVRMVVTVEPKFETGSTEKAASMSEILSLEKESGGVDNVDRPSNGAARITSPSAKHSRRRMNHPVVELVSSSPSDQDVGERNLVDSKFGTATRKRSISLPPPIRSKDSQDELGKCISSRSTGHRNYDTVDGLELFVNKISHAAMGSKRHMFSSGSDLRMSSPNSSPGSRHVARDKGSPASTDVLVVPEDQVEHLSNLFRKQVEPVKRYSKPSFHIVENVFRSALLNLGLLLRDVKGVGIYYNDAVSRFASLVEGQLHASFEPRQLPLAAYLNAFSYILDYVMEQRMLTFSMPKDISKETQAKISEVLNLCGHRWRSYSPQTQVTCQECGQKVWNSEQAIHCLDCEAYYHHSCCQCCSPTRRKRKLFGLSLKELVVQTNEVDDVMDRLIAEVEEHGLGVTGLYRVSGSAVKISNLVSLLQTEDLESIDLHSYGAPVITSVIKQLLKDLKPRLLTLTMFDYVSHSVPGELVGALFGKTVIGLPWKILRHLSRVADREDANKMSAASLAMVFAPTLFHGLDDSNPVAEKETYLAQSGQGPATITISEDLKAAIRILENLIGYYQGREKEEMV